MKHGSLFSGYGEEATGRLMPTPPVVRVHLTAATLDAAAAVCHVRGMPHLVARLDAAATEIRNQTDTPEGNP